MGKDDRYILFKGHTQPLTPMKATDSKLKEISGVGYRQGRDYDIVPLKIIFLPRVVFQTVIKAALKLQSAGRPIISLPLNSAICLNPSNRNGQHGVLIPPLIIIIWMKMTIYLKLKAAMKKEVNRCFLILFHFP